MTWSITPQSHKVFQRNPLVAVVAELRFFPILKLPERVADIQEKVRSVFPAFQDVTRQLVNLQAASPIEVRNERLFQFFKQDESTTLSLTTSTLSVEARRHHQREHYIGDMRIGVEALLDTCGPVLPTRLGLRYVDLIDKEAIERDLGRTTTWSQLISEPFLAVPTGLADLDETLFACEIGSPMPQGGGQTLRYGLMRDGDKRVKFRMDVDRYADNPGDPSKLVELLGAFADDAFSVFIAAMGPDLKAWMPERIV